MRAHKSIEIQAITKKITSIPTVGFEKIFEERAKKINFPWNIITTTSNISCREMGEISFS